MNYATIGTVSHGTLRDADLIESFASELDHLIQRNADEWCSDDDRKTRDGFVNTVWDARELLDDDGEVVNGRESDASDMVGALMECLEYFAAPYCSFGATEGDGSDFGFWPSIESVNDAVRDGDLLQVGDTSDIPSDYVGEVCHVSDHGNVTLYSVENGNARELWAAV